ncbi:hypothetical protein STRNTR1_0614 [Stenotrophomonas maltophilia]|nr:hypothetical protein STRNTR1_0614 [Stenotrophomonas maltophilia]
MRHEVGDFCEGISGLFLEKLNFLFLKLAQLFSKLGFGGGNGIE